MYRKRRKVLNYYNPPRGKWGISFRLILAAIILLAALSGLITGAVLSNNASKSRLSGYGRHNLTEFGGVKEPAADYAELEDLRADYVSISGADKSSFKRSVPDSDDVNAVAFNVNDKNGNIFFNSDVSSAKNLSYNRMSDIKAGEIAEVSKDQGKISVAYFHSVAFAEENEHSRVLKSAEEISIISELAENGINEIIVFGLPGDTESLNLVTSYLSWMHAVCERTNICVVLSAESIENSDAISIINATEGYADAYAIDMSGVSNSELGNMIEKCAYYITQFNMRVLVADANETLKAETLAALEAYKIENYLFVG